MSGTVTRIPRAEAMGIASRFTALLAGAYDRLTIAGSIRRGYPTAGDIEVVATPRLVDQVESDMFGDEVAVATIDLLHTRLGELLEAGVIEKRLRSDGKTFWGPKAKFLTFEDFPIDLFTPEADRWGVILTIRTGPAAYSHMLVTELGQKVVVGHENGRPITRVGRLPKHLQVKQGWLTYRVSGQRIPTPEEIDFYREIGMPYVEPRNRR